MPIYEYRCSACDHLSELLLGINDPAPQFCPSCGAEGTMRKAFAPPAIVFKGTGWAKKDRSTAARSKAAAKDGGDGGSKDGKDAKDAKDSTDSSKASADTKADSSTSAKGGSGSGAAAADPS